MRAQRVIPRHRAVRGWLLALPSMTLAIAAHGAAGGGVPELSVALPLTALVAWTGAAVVHRLRGTVPLIALLGVIQLALHLLLTQIAGSHAHASGPAPIVNGWAMFAAHAAATVLTAGLLANASAALTLVSAALDWLRGQLVVLRSMPVPKPVAIASTSSAMSARPGPLLEILLRRVRSRRGPPNHS